MEKEQKTLEERAAAQSSGRICNTQYPETVLDPVTGRNYDIVRPVVQAEQITPERRHDGFLNSINRRAYDLHRLVGTILIYNR